MIRNKTQYNNILRKYIYYFARYNYDLVPSSISGYFLSFHPRLRSHSPRDYYYDNFLWFSTFI